MSNRLKNEVSPYLLQHSENPVNWYPWCDEAFEKAKNEDKPIFLSIGYSTCHWCHVMAYESFEDIKTAEILNENFVSIKVDREERPDIDSVYMTVCQALTGNGGWPMSIFMTWDKKPFFAGTYFPPNSRYGMTGFSDLLKEIINLWKNDKEKILNSATEITKYIKNAQSQKSSKERIDLTKTAVLEFKQTFDRINGGFGNAPKFPAPHNLLFLILYSKLYNDAETLKMAEETLLKMRMGGIFDHIGFGFSRYSTDEKFLVPHFEKMLYDNALLIMAYSAAYSVSGKSVFLETAKKTSQYVLREMVNEDGGFYSAQDADSDDVEGKYYTFSLNEIINVLGNDRGNKFADTFDITEKGNFNGTNIPNLLKSSDLTSDFENELNSLLEYRKRRTNLHVDDKILTSWNSIMIAALCMLYRISGDSKYLDSAKKAQKFIENNLCESEQIYTSFRNNKHSGKGFSDDYAYYILSLIELYNSTLDIAFLKKAKTFCNEAVNKFYDEKNGGFFLCEKDNNELFTNPKETYDGAIPCSNSVMAYNLVKLYHITEDDNYRNLAEEQIQYMSQTAQNYPSGHSMFLIALMLYESPSQHIKIVLSNSSDLENIRKELPFSANITVIFESEEYPLLNNKTTFYICDNHTCYPPTNIL